MPADSQRAAGRCRPASRPATTSEPAAKRTWRSIGQVRFAAGSLVVAGLLAGRHLPAARWLSAGIGAGLVYSAVTNTCGMAAALARLPHNRAPHQAAGLDATLDALQG